MLSEEERQEILHEIPHYAQREAVCIDAMRIVQKHRGWVSDEALADLAELLQMSTDDLASVASFYNLIFRKPVGKHTIMLCDSVSCWVMGYEKVRQALADRIGVDLGGTSPDGRFTLLPIVCLGMCEHAPAMIVDDDPYVDLDPSRLDGILEKYQ
jgi:NADH-quinone oxidoreductase subunit E